MQPTLLEAVSFISAALASPCDNAIAAVITWGTGCELAVGDGGTLNVRLDAGASVGTFAVIGWCHLNGVNWSHGRQAEPELTGPPRPQALLASTTIM